MFKIADADLRPLEDFPLKWRWTDAKWDLLPTEAIEQINPLSEAKAQELETNCGQYFSSEGFDSEIVESSESIKTEFAEISDVEKWLLERIETEKDFVFISWDKDTAVRTTAEIFCRYWNTFCYPASDDVVITPEKSGWLAAYHHDEKLSFAIIRAEFVY